ncbi:MAG: IS66 family insertion sequence element accessory protein TnpB [Gemmatimonadaceae bacterium]|nr:IS66 family insertion sequence element accessory protein TnpB [Gemmatimonadaceae bacterium]
MIGLAGGRTIFLATGVTDLRRGVTGLYGLILDQLAQEPLSGAVYAFCNRRRDTVKLFCYDTGGVWLCAKRLEEGTFRWPASGTRTVQLTSTDLQLLLSGIDPARTRVRRWWQPVDAATVATTTR